MKVYLAGKIAKNDWRHGIFPSLRNHEANGYTNTLPTRGHFKYTGPFFLGDDHGSYHGEGKHGRGVGMIENMMYPDKKPDSSKKVVKKCLEWIDQSDALFVWLNKEDAYGTIAEIGYAKAQNKIIFLVVDNKFMKEAFNRDIWFIRTMADYVFFEESAEKGWAIFEEKFAPPSETTPFSYIVNKRDKTWIHTKISEFTNRLTSGHSVEELNALDRDDLTAEFLKQHQLQYRSFADFMKDERLYRDIAEEIDYKIVRGYYKNTTNKEAKDLQSWAIEGTGLLYRYEQNYEKEKKNREEKGTFTPDKNAPATPNQLSYLGSLLRKSGFELGVPMDTLHIQQAAMYISHFVDGSILSEEHEALLKRLKPTEFSGTLNASGIVERLKRIFEKEERNITIGVHTKCRYYFERLGLIKSGIPDGKYLLPNEYGEVEYTQEWLKLLEVALRDPDLYAEIKAEKKNKTKK